MPYVNKIVDQLNTDLKNNILTNRYYQAGAYYGVSKLAERENDNTPYIIDLTGAELDVSLNDQFPISIYHRIISTSYDVQKQSVGDGNDMLVEKNTMVCIVYCNSEKVKTNENDLAFQIALGLTKNFNQSEINDVKASFINCYATSTNYNSKQIFKQEYGNNSEYSFAGNDIYFSITYSIDVIASRYCLANC